MNQRLTKICKNFIGELDEAIGNQPSADIFVLTDTNTEMVLNLSILYSLVQFESNPEDTTFTKVLAYPLIILNPLGSSTANKSG